SVSCLTVPAATGLSPCSLHDALPIWGGTAARWRCRIGRPGLESRRPRRAARLWRAGRSPRGASDRRDRANVDTIGARLGSDGSRSEEHTSELQSHLNLVCRLLLEKKK